MSDIDWRISGAEMANCNCAYGCPCQFNALPTDGHCEAVWAMRIERGHYGDVSLDGLAWGFLVWWPGAVHEGNGKMQVFGEERATSEQRRALESIAHGEVSSEGTYFQIFSATAPNFEPSVWAPVEFECDVDACSARLAVDGLVEARAEAIRNPITGAEHRARVALPGGFEYKQAEYGSGSTTTAGASAIPLKLEDSHAHLARVAWDANDCYAA